MNIVHFCMAVVLSFILFFNTAGCSVSYSIDKSSDSISESLDSISASFDSFTSISDSSGSGKKEVQAALRRFRDDVRSLTQVFLGKPETQSDFERQLGAIAANYGIIDWESEPSTFLAIGSGLRHGGVVKIDIQSIPFLQSSAMDKHRELILEGFQRV